jgi:uncharacterized membrane protein YfcA
VTALLLAFALTAFAYATVGFGGGSTYNALLALADVDYHLIPLIALTCNMIVVAAGSIGFLRARLVRWPLILPFVMTSMPMAWIGGQLHVSETLFLGLLGFALLATGLRMALRGTPEATETHDPHSRRLWALGLPLGAILGLLAGIVGIGGGVFLAPLLHGLHWARPKVISASCSVFILLNSAAGLAGQLLKLHGMPESHDLQPYYWLFAAVLLGGQAGSHLGIRVLGAKTLRRLTGLLVFYVSLRLLYQWFNLL